MSGAPEKDLSQYEKWRESAMPENVELLDFYAGWCSSQVDGFSGTLRIRDIRDALDLVEFDQDHELEAVERLLLLHGRFMEHLRQASQNG